MKTVEECIEALRSAKKYWDGTRGAERNRAKKRLMVAADRTRALIDELPEAREKEESRPEPAPAPVTEDPAGEPEQPVVGGENLPGMTTEEG